MHRKVMQVDDDVIFRYFELLSREVERGDRAAEGARRRRVATRRRSRRSSRASSSRASTTTRRRGAAAAEFEKIYAGDAIPADVPEHTLTTDGATLWIAKALSSADLVKSTGEGKRLVEQGGVEVDQVRVTDANLQLEKGKRYLLRVGSKNRRFAYVVVAP